MIFCSAPPVSQAFFRSDGAEGARKVDACLLRECKSTECTHTAPHEFCEECGFCQCERSLHVCRTGRRDGLCFRRHAEIVIPVAALRPPGKFKLIGPVVETSKPEDAERPARSTRAPAKPSCGVSLSVPSRLKAPSAAVAKT